MKLIFESHPLSTLRKEISKTNIKGYSKMRKNEVVKLMMKHQDRFKHIKMNPTFIKEMERKGKVYRKARGDFVPEKDPLVKKQEKKEVKKEAPKKENNLLENMKNLVKKYGKDEIKKQNLTKENLKKYTNPYFDIVEKIEKQLKEVDDDMEFFKNNKELSKKYKDTTKNFIRRLKLQLKKKDK